MRWCSQFWVVIAMQCLRVVILNATTVSNQWIDAVADDFAKLTQALERWPP